MIASGFAASVLVVLLASSGQAGAPRLPAVDNAMEEGNLPTPFSAEEIRQGCPVGRRIVWKIVAGQGAPPAYQRMLFVESDADGAMVESVTVSESGEAIGAAKSGRSSWPELQAHGSYPKEGSLLAPLEDVGSPLGEQRPGWFYRVAKADGTALLVWFEEGRAGPPVRLEQRDAAGITVFRMEMASDDR
jgi:hypothetical protein